MDLIARIKKHEKKQEELSWEGPFREYLELVLENPSLACSAHQRIYDMIISAGWEEGACGKRYKFFSRELFGIEETLRRFVEDYLKPAALGMDVKRRVLLFLGPVGSGKSTIVNLIKRGLETYSKTEAGALYGIKGCPMHEEPLHLVPYELRGELKKRGIHVEGSLCPLCRVMLREKYHGRIEDVLVERFFLSEENRVGIGTFVPSDPKSQDIAELTGSLDFSTIAEYGTESDPRAYKFDGELNKANRGVMEFQELFKCDEKFLYHLLSLAQEGNFKAGRFALISADEMVIGHTNQAEYEEFIRNGRNEALASRLYVIPVPYNLRVSEEERIYRKLLNLSQLGGVHLAPHSLRAAAVFSVLTRLEDPCRQGVSLIKKMHLYDGKGGDFSRRELEQLRQESPGEGMKGIDPRYVINRVCSALAADDCSCVNGLDVLDSLKKGLPYHPLISQGQIDGFVHLLLLAGNEYRALLRQDLTEACVQCFPQAAHRVFKEYFDCLSFYLTQPISGTSPTADEIDLMDKIEGHLEIGSSSRKVFREELYHRVKKFSAMGRDFDYSAHPGLKEAVEGEVLRRVLLEECQDRDLSCGGQNPPMMHVLIEQFGYCPVCAHAAVREVSSVVRFS
ncbi:MAG TPA: protein prkA [Clostridia bacterium]|nr:protein prkA [Clostridia bacterium]